MIDAYDSPVGRLVIGTRDGCVVMCDYENRTGTIAKSFHRTNPDAGDKDEQLIFRVKAQLDKYFSGALREFDLPVMLSGSECERRVYEALMKIPYGVTVSYSEVAAKAGNPLAVRSVASAIGRNPLAIIIPCHRVIGRDGKLHGYAGGLDAKKYLLTIEGSLSC